MSGKLKLILLIITPTIIVVGVLCYLVVFPTHSYLKANRNVVIHNSDIQSV